MRGGDLRVLFPTIHNNLYPLFPISRKRANSTFSQTESIEMRKQQHLLNGLIIPYNLVECTKSQVSIIEPLSVYLGEHC